MLKAIPLFFAALSAAVVAIPGISALGTEAWWPPDPGAQRLFRVVATVVGAGVLLIAFLARGRIAAAPGRVVGPACALGLVLSLALVYAYSSSLDRAVLDYTYENVPRKAIVPFGVGSWATDEVLRAVQFVQPPGGDRPRTPRDVTREHLEPAFQKFDTGMKSLIPKDEVSRTVRSLLLLYCVASASLILTFMTAGIRLGWSLADGGEDGAEAGNAGEGAGTEEPGPEARGPDAVDGRGRSGGRSRSRAGRRTRRPPT
ncbi:MAG TPA: hypothetical protein VF746_14355 [Longimicrobium sp.]|jgi:hypothetical protein